MNNKSRKYRKNNKNLFSRKKHNETLKLNQEDIKEINFLGFNFKMLGLISCFFYELHIQIFFDGFLLYFFSIVTIVLMFIPYRYSNIEQYLLEKYGNKLCVIIFFIFPLVPIIFYFLKSMFFIPNKKSYV